METKKLKKNLILIFQICLFLFSIGTLISNIITAFSKGARLFNGGYYEITQSPWPSGNRSVISKELYVVKRDFLIENCSRYDYIHGNLANYKYIANGATIAFFWIAELTKLILSIIDIYLAVVAYRDEGPDKPTHRNACCRACCKVCNCCVCVLTVLMKVIFISTAYAMPTYFMSAFDYTTPCLKTQYELIYASWEPLILMYYVSIITYAIILFLVAGRSLNENFLRCRPNKVSNSSSESSKDDESADSIGSGTIVSICFTIVVMSVLVTTFTSLIVFFQMLIVKHGAKLTAASSAICILLNIFTMCFQSYGRL